MKSVKKVALFGCKANTKFTFDVLHELGILSCLITINSEKGVSEKVADYADLVAYCKEKNIPVYSVDKYTLKSEIDLAFFKEQQFDLAFVNGWQRLIPDAVLETFSTGIFGMHGSSENLPKGRGRSPMNWAVLEGRKEFYTNLFKYEKGTDDGDILDTYKFHITENDTAETMHFKNTLAMKFLIEKNINDLLTNSFTLKKQANTTPTYYPKRSETDSLIDWSLDINLIEQHIKAVTKPFNGAYGFVNNQKVVIYRAHSFDENNFGFSDCTSGEIVAIFPNGKFLIKVNNGLLLVHDFKASATLKTGDIISEGNEVKKTFKTNENGFHDV